jgi:hypothetical protein
MWLREAERKDDEHEGIDNHQGPKLIGRHAFVHG